MTDLEIRTKLLLSLQRALLGAVSPALREVSCGWRAKQINLRFVYDGEISEVDFDAAHIVGAEVISDFPDGWNIEEDIVRLDAPKKLVQPETAAILVFRKREFLEEV